MATVISLNWPGVTPEEYDRVVEVLGLQAEPADGGLFYIAGFEGGALHVTDVWESEAQFKRFLEARLMPALHEAGVDQGESNVTVYEAYDYFRSPGVEIPEVGTAKVA